MAIKQVLVTGATGKTGSIVFKKLKQAEDFKVRGLARSLEKVKELFGSTEDFDFSDITDIESIKAAFTDPKNSLKGR